MKTYILLVNGKQDLHFYMYTIFCFTRILCIKK